MKYFIAMCLRSVHSLHLHFVQAFRSLRCTSFTSLSFTPFRLRSFHSPQHRTAKAIPSLHFTKQSHRLSVSWHPDSKYTKPTHIRDCSCHSKPPNAFVPFYSVIAFALNPPHNKKRYALFFTAKRLPQPTHKRQYSSN